MWLLADYRFDRKVLKTLEQRGFAVSELDGERVQASKNNVAAIFLRDAKKKLRLAEPPGYLVGGAVARLWDAGYQKFWLLNAASPDAAAARRVPVVAEELKELHRVSEELRTVLGIPSFYNESLGTTCHVTAYDRLRGREGTGEG